MAPQTVVFIDYENAVRSAHEIWGGHGEPVYKYAVEPTLLAQKVLSKRAPGGELIQVRAYRGRPDPRKETTLARVNDRQYHAWHLANENLMIFRRPLRYPHNWGQPGCVDAPREKGVDVQLAVDVVQMAIEKRFEVGILFTRDTDLLPALEAVRAMDGAHVEVATWRGSSRLRLPGQTLHCHQLDREDFEAVRDRRGYNY